MFPISKLRLKWRYILHFAPVKSILAPLDYNFIALLAIVVKFRLKAVFVVVLKSLFNFWMVDYHWVTKA